MKPPLTIYWSRRDFRLTDNSALLEAEKWSTESNSPFLPVFIIEDYMAAGDPVYQFGYPSRYFLSQALPLFAAHFKKFCLVQSKGAKFFINLSAHYNLTIFVNEDVYIDFYTQITKLKNAGIDVRVCSDGLTVDRETRGGAGNLYSVFTPFKNNVWTSFVTTKPLRKCNVENVTYLPDSELKNIPQQINITQQSITEIFSTERKILVGGEVIDLNNILPLPKIEGWYFSEEEAVKRFAEYLKSGDLDAYDKNRNSLELDVLPENESRLAYIGKTSKMSVALAWGLISPRTLVSLLQKHFDEVFDNPSSSRVSVGALTFISELIWREFYRYQLFHFPELMDSEFQAKFRGTIKWENNAVALERFQAWIKGETGYPIVDAAMKQIAQTGWMHNRSRMVVASILTKNLGVDWRWGMEYFRAVLIDLDEASNCGGWQWGASVGADPKPIRIFNPELQAKNYDNSGAYQNRWLNAGQEFSLEAERIPIVEHKDAREDALMRYNLKK